MTHLTIHVNNGGTYSEGDVVYARTTTEIHCCHCEQIAVFKSRVAGQKTPADSSLKQWCDLVYEYRFERVSRTQVLRVTISTNTIDLFGPPEIHVPEFIARRQNAGLFGNDGSEVWYGGNLRYTQHAVDSMWMVLADRFGIHHETHPILNRWPCGDTEVKHFLTCSVDNLESRPGLFESLLASEYVQGPKGELVLSKKRQTRIPLETLGGLFQVPLPHIRDMNREISRRETIGGLSLIFRDDRCERDVADIAEIIVSG